MMPSLFSILWQGQRVAAQVAHGGGGRFDLNDVKGLWESSGIEKGNGSV